MHHAPLALLSLLLPGCDATPVRIPPDPELADTGCARQLAISPAEIRFPLGPVGSDSAVTVTLENVGCHPISLDDLSFKSSDAPFAISAVGSIVLPEGTQTSCQVTYEPNASGITEATMLIESDDPDSPDEVRLFAP